MLEGFKEWALELGAQYGVNPIIFAAIYIGAIPFFGLSITWLVKNYKRGKSIVMPVMTASFCFVSAYLYLAIVGKGIPTWVYVFIGVVLLYGAASTIRRVRARIQPDEQV